MWSVHCRLAELWVVNKERELTEEEQKEFKHCMEANANKAWQLAKLKNLSLLASTTNDTDWQHDLCKQIEEVYPYGRAAL